MGVRSHFGSSKGLIPLSCSLGVAPSAALMSSGRLPQRLPRSRSRSHSVSEEVRQLREEVRQMRGVIRELDGELREVKNTAERELVDTNMYLMGDLRKIRAEMENDRSESRIAIQQLRRACELLAGYPVHVATSASSVSAAAASSPSAVAASSPSPAAASAPSAAATSSPSPGARIVPAALARSSSAASSLAAEAAAEARRQRFAAWR